MNKISIVILTKNVEATLAKTLEAAKKLSDDIIVADSGSTDNTVHIAAKYGINVFNTTWKGFGATRNASAEIAKYDWVFCVDADEVVTDALAAAILHADLKPEIIYGCRRINFLGGRQIKYGEWGKDYVYRLYNRTNAEWNLDDVHEMIVAKHRAIKELIPGNLLHYTIDDIEALEKKTERYARLSAQKYFAAGKKAGFFKTTVSPFFGFAKNYIFRLGFLDGKEGYQLAKVLAAYTKNKYKYLAELYNKNK